MIKGRLKDGVTFDQAGSALEVFSASQAEAYPDTHTDLRFLILPTEDVTIHPMFDGALKTFTFFLMAMVGLVLLIACTNLASMLLARASARRREIGIRLAIGANRFRLIRQLLTESITLALLGGIAGIALAWWVIRLLLALQPPISFPMDIDIAMSGTVYAFAFFLSVATGIIFGLLPSWQTTRPELVSALKDAYGSAVGRLRRFGMRSGLVVSQVAVSALLLVFAGLFLRSLGNASSIDPGFDIRQGVMATFELQEQGYDLERTLVFQRDLVSRVESLPGVESASFAEIVPLGPGASATTVHPETPHVEIDEDGVSVDYCAVDSDYFRTMGIPILSGRAFTDNDLTTGTQVAIINETMAQRYWPGESALGQQITRRYLTRDDEVYTVVGVARDGKYRTLGEDQRSYMYRPTSQDFSGFTNLVVRTSGSGSELLLQVREQIREIDSHLPILGIITMSEHLELMLFIPRLVAWLLISFGLLSLILGTTGLYGVISYDVSRRTREVGIRMSLGAQQSGVLRLIIWDGLKLVLDIRRCLPALYRGCFRCNLPARKESIRYQSGRGSAIRVRQNYSAANANPRATALRSSSSISSYLITASSASSTSSALNMPVWPR
jgi:predicted permease